MVNITGITQDRDGRLVLNVDVDENELLNPKPEKKFTKQERARLQIQWKKDAERRALESIEMHGSGVSE